MSRIVVTGMGVISAIGNSVAENRNSLAQGICGISSLEYFASRFAAIMPFGEIKTATESLKEKLDIRDASVTRNMLLALHAFREAATDAGLSGDVLQSRKTALICGNTVGGMCLTDELYADTQSTTTGSAYLGSYDAGAVIAYIQELHHMKGIVNTFNTACSSSANAIMYGAKLLQHGYAQTAIVGGSDTLAKFTINGFNALRILSDEKCRPFDKDRKGLNLGEGAAFLVLEREEDAVHKNKYAVISGYANTNDAFHASSLSPEGYGPLLAMRGALEKAALLPAQISFINAHGTATENNDAVESVAMLELFKTPPPFASTKCNTGHTLGAAGAVEAVYSILNLVHQEVYPALQFTENIPATGLVPVQHYEQKALEHIMSNSFGFGGNCTSLIFSTYNK